MAISKLRPQFTFTDANLQRTFNDVYKVLNELNDSVKSPSGLAPVAGEGNSGDIRVYKDSRTGFHVLSANVDGEWVSIGMTKDEGKPFTGFGVTKADFSTVKKGTNTGILAFNKNSGKIEEKETVQLSGDEAIFLQSGRPSKPRISITNMHAGVTSANLTFFKSPIDNSIANNDFTAVIGFYGDTATGDDSSAAVTDGSQLHAYIAHQITEVKNDGKHGKFSFLTYDSNSSKTFTMDGGVFGLPGGAKIDNTSDISQLAFHTEDSYLFGGGNSNGEPLKMYLVADNVSPDNADKWLIQVADGGTMTFESYISGSYVSHLTVTPHATIRSSSVTIPGELDVTGGTITVGVDGSARGILKLWDGSGTNQAAYIQLYSRNGTAYYLFVEDDGTVKLHTSAPVDNADGDEVGGQS